MLEDYVDVATRIQRFYERCPTGRIVTEPWKHEGDLCVFRAAVFRTEQDREPAATGWAYEREGSSRVNETSFVENCETSAIGRALANLGFPVHAGEPRPSRQEMEKVRRASPPPQPAPDNDEYDGDAVCCPKCSGPVWDNRRTNQQRVAEGKKALPIFKCKGKDCDGVIWGGRPKPVATAAPASPFAPDDGDLHF